MSREYTTLVAFHIDQVRQEIIPGWEWYEIISKDDSANYRKSFRKCYKGKSVFRENKMSFSSKREIKTLSKIQKRIGYSDRFENV